MKTRSLLAIAVFMAGCASSPPAHFYRLVPEAPVSPQASTSSRTVIVGPFQLAEYLERPEIVMRNGDNSVTVADFERWAEPLDANFQSVVAANVSRLLGSDRVLEFPAQAVLKPARRVTGRVSQLDLDRAGHAVVEVQWGVLAEDGTATQPARRSRYETAAAGASYAAKVAALSSAIAQFSADVAAAVK